MQGSPHPRVCACLPAAGRVCAELTCPELAHHDPLVAAFNASSCKAGMRRPMSDSSHLLELAWMCTFDQSSSGFRSSRGSSGTCSSAAGLAG